MLDIKKIIGDQIKELLHCDQVTVEIPPKENMGDYSVPCFELRNEALPNPNQVANYIKDHFEDPHHIIQSVDVIGPYANFNIDYDVLSSQVIQEIEEQKETFGSRNQGHNEALLIEHTSINPNAEPHIGRCRNSLIGDFMSNLYHFTGFDVERHYFINDLGKKIALLVIGIEKYGLKNDDFSSILDVYVQISKDASQDPALEQKSFDYLEQVENGNEEMIERFKKITDMCVAGQMKIFDELDIHFDIFTHESDYVYNNYLTNILDQLQAKGKLKEDELGRYYVDLSDYKIPTKEPVLVLTRSNKTSLYPIKDIAYTIDKINRNRKHNFIVLGEDQEVYMQQISAVLDILGYPAPELISYSYVLLEGEKMSTSGGTVVLVTDFIREVKNTLKEEFQKRNLTIDDENLTILCNACIKFTMLNVSKQKIVNFNLDNATSFTGESGIYILYNIVRINSILKNNPINGKEDLQYQEEQEKKMIKLLSQFPELVDELLTSCEPAHLTKYIFHLTQEFSRFYEQTNISNESNEVLKQSRLRLLWAVRQVLINALSILGIKTIEKM